MNALLARLTPLGLVAVLGLGSYALVRTGVMGFCHVTGTFGSCEAERKAWEGQMGMVASGFFLLFIKSTDGAAMSRSRRRMEDGNGGMPPWDEPGAGAAYLKSFRREPQGVVITPDHPDQPSDRINKP